MAAKLSRRDHEHIEWCKRMRRKVSRKAVAQRLKVHLSTVAQIEQGAYKRCLADFMERQNCDD